MTLLMVASHSPWKTIFSELLIFVLQSCLLIQTYSQPKRMKSPIPRKRRKKACFKNELISWTAALRQSLYALKLQCTQTCSKTKGISMRWKPILRQLEHQGKIENWQNSARWGFHYLRLRVSFEEKIWLQNNYQKLIKNHFSRAIRCNHEQSSIFFISWDM